MKRMILAAALCCAAAPALAQGAPPAARVYELAEVETRPVPSNVEVLRAALAATYPLEKRAAGQGARVSVSFVLDTDGVPGALDVIESTDAAFDAATLAGIALLRFTPARVGGQPVAVRVEVPVEWRLDEAAQEFASTSEAEAADAGVPESSDGVRVYALADVDEPPAPANLPVLQREMERLYPAALRNAGVQGQVQARFVITERGEVVGAAVTSSTDPRFNAVTLEAVRALRFRPGRVAGQAVRTQVELPIQWTVAPPSRSRRN